MGIRKSIFDSNAEIGLYQHLSELWKDRVLISDHVPVNNVIDLYSKNIFKDEREKFLLKSNFDFVVASKEQSDYGRPLLVIEFDGIGKGFSDINTYIQVNETEDKYRKLKMDCKIRICEEVGLPLIVISWDEITNISIDHPFSIIDGIIGKVLWHDEFKRLFQQNDEEFNRRIKKASSKEERQDIVDQFGAACEVQADNNVSPIVKKATQYFNEIHKRKLIKKWGFGGAKEGKLEGYKYFAYLNDEEETYISQTILVRTVNCSKATGVEVARDIAELLLWEKILKKHPA